MIIGYARASTKDQNLDMQVDAIEKFVNDMNERLAKENQPKERLLMFSEFESGGKLDRAELFKALDQLEEGDTLVVYKLDRLGRSAKQLHEIKDQLETKKVKFVSLNENIDTSTPMGKAMFGMVAVFAEFERETIKERTRAGLEAAKRRGRTGGRPSLSKDKKKQIVKLFQSGESAAVIAKEYGIARSTVYKVLKEFEEKND